MWHVNWPAAQSPWWECAAWPRCWVWRGTGSTRTGWPAPGSATCSTPASGPCDLWRERKIIHRFISPHFQDISTQLWMLWFNHWFRPLLCAPHPRIVEYITKDCPSCTKVVNTVNPWIRYSAATRSGAQGVVGGKIQIQILPPNPSGARELPSW